MKLRIYYLIILLVFLFGIDVYRTNAQADSCLWESELLDPNGKTFKYPAGVSITVEQTVTDPPVAPVKNVIVYGQDEEEEGVSMTIKISALPGIINHHEWDEHLECRYYDKYQKGRDDDLCNETDYGWYYNDMVKYCNKNLPPRTVRRNISDVVVWLQPSQETLAWLGWGTKETETGKATLPYIFPSRWMVGTWTGDGFKVEGTPDVTMSPEYTEKWFQQMKEYNFLAGDSQTLEELWSVTLDEVPNPDPDGSGRVLGLFGNFKLPTIPYDIPTAPRGSEYAIDYSVIRENMNASGKHWAASMPNSPNLYTMGTAGKSPDATIKLIHIPIDLPGIWYIGVMVEMEKANFVYEGKYPRTVFEDADWGDSDVKWFSPSESNYDPLKNYFYVYVLLTSPCNELEENGCWDGSY
jgi:hypothetical protein